MSMTTILSTYKAKDEAFFTAIGTSKEAGLKLITGFLMDVSAEKKLLRIKRNSSLTEEQKASRKAKRDARRADLKAAMALIKKNGTTPVAAEVPSTATQAAAASTKSKVAKSKK